MKIRIVALFLAVTLMFSATSPEVQAFEKIDRAIMNMIRNMRSNRGQRRVRRPRRAQSAQLPAPTVTLQERV